MKKLMFIVVIGFGILSGCNLFGPDIPPEIPQYEDFDSPEDMLDNPVVIEALDETGFDYTTELVPEDSPLALNPIEGVWETDASFLDASDLFKDLVGRTSNHLTLLYGKTASGDIIYEEWSYEGAKLFDEPGSFVRGSESEFTIYFEGNESDQGITIYYVTMISGTFLPGGDIEAEVITIVVRTEGTGDQSYSGWYSGTWDMSLKTVPVPTSVQAEILFAQGSDLVIRITWDRTSYFETEGYEIYRVFSPIQYVSVSDPNQILVLQPANTIYDYYVKAIGIGGRESEASNVVRVNTY